MVRLDVNVWIVLTDVVIISPITIKEFEKLKARESTTRDEI